MDGGALRLTASGGPSSGHCRPAPRSQHPQRALDADRCAGRRHPVLFSAAKSISFSPSAPSLPLLGRAAATFPGPPRAAGHSIRPAVLRNRRIAPTHAP